MSEDYLVQEPLAMWSPVCGVWEKWNPDLFSEQWEPFLEIWPTSGMMQDGVVYQLQMPELRTRGLEYSLLPTPTARDFKDGTADHFRGGVVQTDTIARAVLNSGEVTETSWGKYEMAVINWESRLGTKAPAASKPDGRGGVRRLNPELTEWMMGLPAGWVTGCEMSRKETLKMIGNGVVPQQAEYALRLLLTEDILEKLNQR